VNGTAAVSKKLSTAKNAEDAREARGFVMEEVAQRKGRGTGAIKPVTVENNQCIVASQD
jgi:hypothetical protein